jgi:hypothetical protein
MPFIQQELVTRNSISLNRIAIATSDVVIMFETWPYLFVLLRVGLAGSWNYSNKLSPRTITRKQGFRSGLAIKVLL